MLLGKFMYFPRSTLMCKFLDSFNRLVFAWVFIVVFFTLTKLMNFGQALFADLSLSPAHTYGARCIVLATRMIFCKLPLCQICRKGQQVVHIHEKKTQLKWLIFHNINFVRIVFSLACSTSSYHIELVTEMSCLLFYISDFCLHYSFYHNTFLACLLSPTVDVVGWPGLLYLYWCSVCSSSCLADHSCPDLCAYVTCLLICRVSDCE